MKTHKTTSRGPLSRAHSTSLLATAAVWCIGGGLLLSSAAQAQNLFESDYNSGIIYEFTNGIASGQGTFATGLSAPSGLAFDRAGDLFEMDGGTGQIYEFTNGAASERGVFATGLNGDNGLAFDRAGDLFVADFYSGNIYEFTNGVASERGIFASNLPYSYDIAFNSTGDLFVASIIIINGVGNNGTYITKITPAGSASRFYTGTGALYGLAFDSAGDLFASDYGTGAYGTGQIYEFTNGVASEEGTIASGLAGVGGLAIDNAGDLFVAGSQGNNIYEFTNGVATGESIFATGLNSPNNLAFAPNQTPTFNVAIKMFAGIILNNGQIGSNYLIQATANLSSSNWTTLTNVTLLSQPYIYIDYSSYTNSQQFYRAQLQ